MGVQKGELQRGMRRIAWVMNMFHILTEVVVLQIYTGVKTYLICALKICSF